jgi:pyridinium-3,5-bisthiocarboxylic acid mononucleotide nickel chelatase
MVSILYFDCFSGVAGDMVLGSLLDVGVEVGWLRGQIDLLGLSGFSVEVRRVESHHLMGTDVLVSVSRDQPHRSLGDILKIVEESGLSTEVKEKSVEIFTRLADVEGRIHGIAPDKIHFHEVGAIDSIIDVVGSVAGVSRLGVDRVMCSPLPLGHGFVRCAHGLLPVPAPATVELLKGVPVYQTDREQELVTPTGAALMTSLAGSFVPVPPMRIEKVGYGAGKTQSEYPSLLRVLVGEQEKEKKMREKA